MHQTFFSLCDFNGELHVLPLKLTCIDNSEQYGISKQWLNLKCTTSQDTFLSHCGSGHTVCHVITCTCNNIILCEFFFSNETA